MDKIFIAGAGGIGRAAALLILDAQDWECEVILGDASEHQLQDAQEWIQKGIGRRAVVQTFLMASTEDTAFYENILSDCDVMLDCLPGALAPSMARLCIHYGLHYANLTEHIEATQEIMAMAADAETAFILQTGLAPGYVNNLAMHLVDTFRNQYGVEKLERLAMRVGALTQYTESPHYYGFTWSTIGVATEYIVASEAVRNHEIVSLPSLSEKETLIINGRRYEADLTSGGSADLADALKDDIAHIDYKTIRYPGHFEWVTQWVNTNRDRVTLIQDLEKYLISHVPHVEDDVIVIYASVSGYDKLGNLRSIQHAQHVYPLIVGGITMRAIQTCTAAPLVECARLLLSGEFSGVITQSQIDPAVILEGTIVRQAFQEVSEG